MNKKLFTFSFGILLLFSVIGIVTSSMIIHELSHKQDFKEISRDGYTALFVIPDNTSFKSFITSPGAIYNFYPTEGNKEESNRILKYTEIKAYLISTSMILFYIVAMIIVMLRLKNEE